MLILKKRFMAKKEPVSKELKYSVGIDVSKDDVKICFSSIDEKQHVKQKGSRKFSNTLKGYQDFEVWIEKHRKDKCIPLVLTIEATGTYYENIALYFHEKAYTLNVVLASQARQYMKSSGFKSKTDKIDALGLSIMGAEKRLAVWKPMSKFMYQLRSITRKRKQLIELKTCVNNQQHAHSFSMYLTKEVIESNATMIEQIDIQIEQLEKAINAFIDEDIEVKQKIDVIVEKLKGVGALTVVTLLAETGCFSLFEGISQLISYSGYDVVQNDSGKHIGKTKISKKGNSYIRHALFMPALSVVRYKVPVFKNLYDRIFERTKIGKKACVAVQRKLLIIIYTLWKKGTAFQDNYKMAIGGMS